MYKFNSENRTALFWFITQRVELTFLQILAASEVRNAWYSATLRRKAAIMQNITQSVHSPLHPHYVTTKRGVAKNGKHKERGY
jgi:hypothetical protein